MHVTYVLCQDEGGLPHYTAELANAVAERATVSVVKPTATTADEFFDPAVDVHGPLEPLNVSVPTIATDDVRWRDVATSLRSYANVDVVHDLDPDVVHLTASTELFPYMKYFVWRSGVDTYPFVETVHNVDPDRWVLRLEDLSDVDRTSPLKWLLVNNAKNLLSRALPTPNRDLSLVHTEKHERHLVDRGTPPDRVRVVPHGVYEIFDRDGVDVETEENTVLFFGNVVGRKGPDTLVEAIPIVRERIPDVTAVIAGRGSLPPSSRETVAEYDEHFEVHDRFVPNDEVAALHERAQVVALPHRRLVGTSGTLTIAYASGTPVVATDVGSYPELVSEPGCGLVVPPDDPEALADALVTLLTDDDRRRAMAENTAEVRRELSWSSVADRHVALYESLLSDEG